jgi:DNA repair exonuclease SbcCD ATPase subunit
MTEFAPTETRVSIAGFEMGAPGITPPSNPDRRGVFLADVVVELGLADEETIEGAVRSAQEAEKSLESYLLDTGILDEDKLSRAIAERNGLDHVDLDRFEVDTGAAEMVTRSAAERYNAVPVAFASDGAVIVAVEDPFDTLGISDIEVMTRSEVRPAIATASGIRALIDRLPDHPASKPPPPPSPEPEAVPEPMQEIEAEAEFDEADSQPPPPAAAPDPTANGVTGLGHAFEPVSDHSPEPETFTVPEPVSFAVPEQEESTQPESEPEPEAPPELEPEVESEPEPEPIVPFDPEPVPQITPEPEPTPDLDASASGELADLSTELGALQETARRADELAVTVERRIEELKGADERAQRLERELLAAQRRIDELEQRLSGVDTAAEELRATTEKLEEVSRALEGSVG